MTYGNLKESHLTHFLEWHNSCIPKNYEAGGGLN